jgi:uncharacterized RDD family membrane protein YckC
MGPIPQSELESLVLAGVIEPTTLVWHEGMPGWQMYSSVRNGVGVAASNSEDEVPGVVGMCSQCEDVQLHSEMVRFGADWVCANCKEKYTQRLREGTLGRQMVYASVGTRVGAGVIDILILWVLQMAIQLAYTGTGGLRTSDFSILTQQYLVLQLLSIATAAAYNASFVYQFGGTPGKLALGCRIVTADGGKLSLNRSIGRYFASMLSAFTLGIGYLIAAFDEERRTLHDRICDTRVILKKSGRFV